MRAFLIPLALYAANCLSALAGMDEPVQFPGVDRPQTAPYRADQLNKAPRLLQRKDPEMPIISGLRVANPRVIIQIIINESGEVWSAEVKSGEELLKKPALEAVRQWRYEPMLVDGQPVPVVTSVAVIFSPLIHADSAPKIYRSQAQPPGREPIRTGGNVQGWKLIHRVDPVYPEEAKAAGLSGAVILQVTTNEAGEVYEARILRGHPLVNNAVIDAVLQWKYSPTYLNGEPIPVIATVSVTFSLRLP